MKSLLFLPLAILAAVVRADDITIIGDGGENIPSQSPAKIDVKPNACYRFTFAARRDKGASGNCLCSGFVGLNVDVTQVGESWREESYVLPVSDETKQAAVRFGAWKVKGAYHVRGDWKVEEVVPHYASFEGAELGTGEGILGNTYYFESAWSQYGRLQSRTLTSYHRCSFNTDRVDLGAQGELRWEFGCAGRQLTDGDLSFVRGYHTRGELIFEASRDGAAWERVLLIENASNLTSQVTLPASLFPCEKLQVRVRATQGGIRLYGLSFKGQITGTPVAVVGTTRYARPDESLAPFPATVPAYYAATSGALLPGGTPFLSLWQESSGTKVSQLRKPPVATCAALEVKTAAHEAEAVQLVLSAQEDLADVSVSLVGELQSAAGVTLPTSCVDVLRVGYQNIALASSPLNARGCFPDPLPPQTAHLAVRAAVNQPFWVRVKPPRTAKAGLYSGALAVTGTRRGGEAFRCEVPFRVEVFGFSFPDGVTCKTAFGLYPHFISQYHRLKTPQDRARVYPLYLKAMADYHLSPYSPALTTSWRVRWEGLAEAKAGDLSKLNPVFDFAKWDEEMSHAFATYHFNSFRVGGGLGLGGGDSNNRHEPDIAGFKEGTPAYDLMLEKLLKGFEAHLREKGWLDKAIVYCFDEPPVNDNSFVMNGFAKLKRHAPALRRFLTSPVRADLVGGPQIWCPIAPDLHAECADARRAAGDEFWWYVCTGPKPPYPGLFTDNPGVDLRVWLWQGWDEDIKGVLVWTTNLWNSKSKYSDPEHPQNPYEDPMGWDPRGRPWGNGDGRFFYPPLASVQGDGKGPIFDAPVGSIRGEMLRDGIEDYEYFVMLKRLLAEKGSRLAAEERNELAALLKVPQEVSRSLTDYNHDPAAMEAHRVRLARAIVRLGAL